MAAASSSPRHALDSSQGGHVRIRSTFRPRFAGNISLVLFLSTLSRIQDPSACRSRRQQPTDCARQIYGYFHNRKTDSKRELSLDGFLWLLTDTIPRMKARCRHTFIIANFLVMCSLVLVPRFNSGPFSSTPPTYKLPRRRYFFEQYPPSSIDRARLLGPRWSVIQSRAIGC
ncbi:hypothetical protein RSAG8_00500, partial [Rhizoctonia solani AG-8 WAC10335]